MKTHIIFSYKNWKNDLNGVVEKLKSFFQSSVSAETNRATESEEELKKNVMFVEDEIADAFTEINDERRRITAEITRATAAEAELLARVEVLEAKIL